MSYDDDSSYSDWKESKTKGSSKSGKQEKQKYSQKFCEKWMKLFDPWLSRCSEDPTKPFCRACQCRLDSNRCHLKRHERTTKHAKNLEILINKGEGAAKQNLSIRQERSKYYQQRRKFNESFNSSSMTQEISFENAEDYIEETDGTNTFFQFVQADQNNSDQLLEEHKLKLEANSNDGMGPAQTNYSSITHEVRKAAPKAGLKKERMKLLMQIQKDKNDLMESFKSLMGSAIPQSPPRERNHVDIFFESVSSSVKAFSPKLVAEAKMRVSQLMCELEVRALNEMDANNINSSANVTTTVIVPTDEHNSTENAFIISTPRSVVRMEQPQREDHDPQDFESLS